MTKSLTFKEVCDGLAARGRLIAPSRERPEVRTGEPALFVDERGRMERVLVNSDSYLVDGETMRLASFLDRDGAEYGVRAACLAACDADFRPVPVAPESLRPSARRWDIPYTAKPVQRAPVMDKFERVAVARPRGVRLDGATMSPNQRDRLSQADGDIAAAEELKTARARVAAGRVVGYRRMSNEELTLRNKARDAYEQLQRETAAANDREEVKDGRNEMLALAHGRGETYAWSGTQLSRKNGLDALLMSGALTHSEHAAGNKYGEMYAEAQEGELRTAAWNPSGGGSAMDPDAERLRRLRELEAKARLTDIHGFVQANVSSNRAVTVLRLIAGEGRHVSHVSKGGADRVKNTEALKASLSALADKWGIQ